MCGITMTMLHPQLMCTRDTHYMFCTYENTIIPIEMKKVFTSYLPCHSDVIECMGILMVNHIKLLWDKIIVYLKKHNSLQFKEIQ